MEKDYKKMYEDALERAMNLAMTNNISALAAGEIFPELNESEDEKIKKEIIKLVHFFYGSSLACKHLISEDSMIAWLEKQNEQKPAWSEDDEQYLLVCKNALYKYQSSDKWDATIIYNWLEKKLKSLKDNIQLQPKQEWGEKDKEMLDNCLGLIQEIDSTQEEQNWLRSLKPNHWKPSEQNIKDLEWCADLVKDKMGVGFHRLQVFIDEIKKL